MNNSSGENNSNNNENVFQPTQVGGGVNFPQPVSGVGPSTDVSPLQPEVSPVVVPDTNSVNITPTVVVPRTDFENTSASVSNINLNTNTNTNSSSVPVNMNNPSGVGPSDDMGMVNEDLKKVEINYTPPSKFKTVVLIFFFILLIAFVIFLPEISSLVRQYTSRSNEVVEEKITTGKLNCSLKTSTSNLDMNYDYVFYFTDNQLEKTEFIITTRGDSTMDEETLNELSLKCENLSQEVSELVGVTVRCTQTVDKLVETQSFDLSIVDMDQLNSAFIEAGVNNPEYRHGQDIDAIERSMNASNHTCSRER